LGLLLAMVFALAGFFIGGVSFSWDLSAAIDQLTRVDVIAFFQSHKFEVMASCGLAYLLLYIMAKREQAFEGGPFSLVEPFTAGRALVIGPMFVFVALAPERVAILAEFREVLIVCAILFLWKSAQSVQSFFARDDDA